MADDSGCCSANDGSEGCLVCGAPLLYSPRLSFEAVCHFCGKRVVANVCCLEGHYVCDDCHRGGSLASIERVCAESAFADPLALALEVFRLPGLPTHGPEYHSIVPAVIVAAYGNATGRKDALAIGEAIERGKAVCGGACGSHGACGAGVGVGIAYSVIHGVTPYSAGERGEANLMTASALTAIARFGGPRCCRRDSLTAIEVAVERFGVFDREVGPGLVCDRSDRNSTCLHEGCPYFAPSA